MFFNLLTKIGNKKSVNPPLKEAEIKSLSFKIGVVIFNLLYKSFPDNCAD